MQIPMHSKCYIPLIWSMVFATTTTVLAMDDKDLAVDVQYLIRLQDNQHDEIVAKWDAVVAQGERLYPIIRQKLRETSDAKAIGRLLAMVLEAPGDRTKMLPAIRDLVDSEAAQKDPGVLVYVARTLGKIGGKADVPVLMRLLEHDEWRVRSNAADALGMLGDSQNAAALVAMLYDPHPNVRRAAAEALGKVGDESALWALEIWEDQAAKADVRRPQDDAALPPEERRWLTDVMLNAIVEARAAIRERIDDEPEQQREQG